MSKYLQILNYLLSLGPKLPVILASIEQIMAEVQVIADTLGSGVGAAVEASPAEAEAEAKLVAEVGVSGPLQNILAFIRNNPELIAMLLKLIG